VQSSVFARLIAALKTLPGVTTKHARLMADHIFNQDQFYIDGLIKNITDAKTNVHYCIECNGLCENKNVCDYCTDRSRDQMRLCIVTNDIDAEKIENTKTYYGRYYILRNEINVLKKNGIDHEIFHKLLDLIKKNHVHEIIIATN
jgi:recombination protein RecR